MPALADLNEFLNGQVLCGTAAVRLDGQPLSSAT